ncbi:hypothetical protein BT095_00740 [Corynebacterium diphtheriae]|uniref:hypothetical protein n=1 Tax=Corynebacterium diphtheriae TaxID=1717 RepID=UPI000D056900|nr:hypothetical protein [Corynebacterium diphtheriae]PSA84432.1 hypothetical protein BT095_00740 [Corynebacterium diphtheriae]
MRMKVTYNYNIQCCLTATAKAFALFLFAIPPASAQPSGITSIIRWPVGTSDNFSSATRYRNSAWAVQQHLAGSDYLTVQLGDRQATFTRSAARLLLLGALMLGEATHFEPAIGTAIDHAISQGRPYNFTLSDEELIRNWGTPQRLETAHKPRPNRGTIP